MKSQRQRSQTHPSETARAQSARQRTVQTAMEQAALRQAVAQPDQASPEAVLQLQRRFGNRAVQRLMRRPTPAAPIGLAGGEVSRDLQDQIDSARGGGRPLERGVSKQIGRALGADLSGVRVHTDTTADTLNRSISAQAFTTGSDVFFSHGAYDPGTASGKQLLAHELTHVVQQGGSGAQAVQAKLTVGPADDQYEQEADRVASQVMRQVSTPPPLEDSPVETLQRAPGIQRTLRTVQKDTHSYTFKDNKPDKKKQAYIKGASVDVDMDSKQQDAFGNVVWFKLTTDAAYIKATRLAAGSLATEPISDTEQAKLPPEAVKTVLAMLEEGTFKVPVHGKPVEMTMAKGAGRDAGYDKGFLTDAEKAAIERLSGSSEGKRFLAQHGFLNTAEVKNLAISDSTAGNWERLEKHAKYKVKGVVPTPIPGASGRDVFSNLQRLQIATEQRDMGLSDPKARNTPGYLRYEGSQVKHGETQDIKDQVRQDIYERDTQVWKDTLESQTKDQSGSYLPGGKETEAAINILRRIFVLLHDGIKYQDKEKKQFNKEWEAQVAVAMSHGGRVMIKLPPLASSQEDENAFINWLLGNNSGEKSVGTTLSNLLPGAESQSTVKPQDAKSKETDYYKAGVDTRMASSHSIKINEKEFTEEKGNTSSNAVTAPVTAIDKAVSKVGNTVGNFARAVRGKVQKELKGPALKTVGTATHYGLDLPLGGLGKTDVAGDTILPDGRHGHLYIYYDPPTLKLPGGVLIGLETSRGGRTDVFGQYHDIRGAPAEFSSVGTAKSVRIGQEIDGRVIDYTTRTDPPQAGDGQVKSSNWLQQLKTAEQNVKDGLISSSELVGKTRRGIELEEQLEEQKRQQISHRRLRDRL